MQLHIGEFNDDNATALIRWCLSPQEIERLKKFKRQPMVAISVITVSDNGEIRVEENRFVRPLTDLAAYIAFRNVGKHLILVGVLNHYYSEPGESKNLQTVYRRYSGFNEYKHTLVHSKWNRDNDTYGVLLNDDDLFENIQTQKEVYVAENLFAPIPWDYKLVNFWFHQKPIDQCHNRKRRLGAYALTVTLLPIIYLLRILFNVLLVNGVGGITHINWRWFIHPFTSEFEIPTGEQYFRLVSTSRTHDKPLWRVLINWRVLLLTAGVLFFIIDCLLPILLAHGTAAIVVTIVLLLLAAVIGIGVRYNVAIGKMLSEWEKADRADAAKKLAVELNSLNCQLVPKTLTLDSLPSDKKTLSLRFYRLKSKVCRPFAGS